MAEADQHFDRLTNRTKEAAARVHASTSTTRDKLKTQVSQARAAADKTTQELQAKAATSRDEASQRWTAIRRD